MPFVQNVLNCGLTQEASIYIYIVKYLTTIF